MPDLQNLLVEPQVHIVSDEPSASGEREAVLRVDGLVCRLCAARVRQSIKKLPQVSRVRFDSGNDTFTITYSADQPEGQALQRAAASAVIAPGIRHLIGFRSRQAGAG